MENKTDLRIRIKSQRKTLDTENPGKIIIKNIRNTHEYNSAKNVMIFYPMKYEINLLDLLNDNKNFYFPKVFGDELLVCPDCGKFVKSSFNVMEPISEPVNPEILDLIIVPALAVDKNKYRLGYGGGFYDRFLNKYPNIKTLTPVCKKFLLEEIPRDTFDKAVDVVITD